MEAEGEDVGDVRDCGLSLPEGNPKIEGRTSNQSPGLKDRTGDSWFLLAMGVKRVEKLEGKLRDRGDLKSPRPHLSYRKWFCFCSFTYS
jgi:hypothetical protein